MKIGCVKEIKNREYRVGLIPSSAREYVNAGHEVLIQSGAGLGSSIPDADYASAGAKVLPDALSVWEEAEMIVKVKEPLPEEYPLMRPGQILYAYFHFAASQSLTKACLERKITAVAYETMRDAQGGLPLLKPMSEVAGSMAPLMGAYYLMKPKNGLGLLPTGVPGVAPADVVVLGGGVVGRCSARVAAGMGCRVTVFDNSIRALTDLKSTMPANVFTEYSTGTAIANALKNADMVIGAVLIPGAKAPKLVRREDLKSMKPGCVIVDVAIDQGGCFDTSRPTTHDDPVYELDGVVHYCVANMPGAYSRTSTISLNNATLSYGLEIAQKGIFSACRDNNTVLTGLNMTGGKITCGEISDAFGMQNLYQDPKAIIGG